MNNKTVSYYPLATIALLVYLFLYIPIIVLVLFSFNESGSNSQWSSFSLIWYKELFQSVDILDALKNSLIVAISSVILSISLGLMFVYYSAKSWLHKGVVAFYANLAAPEIVIAVGLLTFLSSLNIPLGITSLIAGHTLIGLGYVIPIIQSRFNELDDRYTEASLDLGASRTQTLFRVILPLMMPAIISGGILVFIISLDDFVLSFFTAGGSTQTLPMYIFSLIRSGDTSMVNAISSVLLAVSSLAVLVYSLLTTKNRAQSHE